LILSAHCDSRGWLHWPGSEAYSAELRRLLAVSQEGGATVAECLLAASRIDVGDSGSWRQEWKRLADSSRERAERAFVSGNIATAQNNWLRAANYYLAASMAVQQVDADRPETPESLVSSVRLCVRSYLQSLCPRGEIVSVPWLEERSLEGYFLSPAEPASGTVPAVICIGESGRRKNELLFAMARHARARGMALLCADLGGESGSEAGVPDQVGKPETSVVALVDYLLERGDIDGNRIAVIGDGGTSSWVTRGVAFDRRLAAAVCDGGIWELWESEFGGSHGGIRAIAPRPPLARTTGCPILVVMDEHGWLDPEYARKLLSQSREANAKLSLKVFGDSEIGASHASADNPTVANEFIFDWIERQLNANTQDRGRPCEI